MNIDSHLEEQTLDRLLPLVFDLGARWRAEGRDESTGPFETDSTLGREWLRGYHSCEVRDEH